MQAASRKCLGLVSALLHFHQAAIERGSAAEIGKTIGCERIDAASVRRTLVPANGGCANHTRANLAIHFRHQDATAAPVEHPDPVPVRNSAWFRVGPVQE